MTIPHLSASNPLRDIPPEILQATCLILQAYRTLYLQACFLGHAPDFVGRCPLKLNLKKGPPGPCSGNSSRGPVRKCLPRNDLGASAGINKQ